MSEKKSVKGRPAVIKGKEKGGVVALREMELHPKQIEKVMESLPVAVDLNLQVLMAQAIDRQVSIDYLKQLVELFNDIQAKLAEKQFNADLALAQAEFPIIEKKASARDHTRCETCRNTGVNKDGNPCPDGKILYVYAPREDIVEKIAPIAARYGFSATSKAKASKHPDLGIPMMAATCVVRHRGGHVVETTIEVPIGEGTRLMSPMQTYMAAASFAERYAYKKAFGIAERGEDVDNIDPPPSEPRAVAGVVTDDLGRTEPEKSTRVDPAPPVAIDKARSDLQRCLHEIGQIYSRDWKPLVERDATPVISEVAAKKAYPNLGPYNRLFSEKELEAYQKDGKSVWGDAEALASKLIDWMAALAGRKIDLLGKAR